MNPQFNTELSNIYSKFGLTEAKKPKPDFLDVDKDGDRKEPFKKATKEAKGGKTTKNCSCGCLAGKPKKNCTCKKCHPKHHTK